MPFDSLAETPQVTPFVVVLRLPFALCLFCCTWERNLTCVADFCAATSRTHRCQYWSLQCEDVVIRNPSTGTEEVISGVRSFSQIRIPAPCFEHLSRHVPVCYVSVMSISVTAWTEASSSRKDSSLLSLIFLLVSTAQSYPGVFSEPSDSEQQRLSLLRCP